MITFFDSVSFHAHPLTARLTPYETAGVRL
jgi:hypothetical protein